MTADKNKGLGCDPEPFATNTTQNAPDFIALAVSQQAMATLKAQFQLAGHHVHESQTGSFLVSRQGMSRHCENFHELRKFARMVGVKLPEGDALNATLAGHQAAQDALDQIARGAQRRTCYTRACRPSWPPVSPSVCAPFVARCKNVWKAIMSFDRNLLPDPTTYFEDQGLKLSGPRSAKWKTTECEFHGGSDSMRVNTASGGWCCMACDCKGGDVLSYHMQLHGLEFIGAAQQLGAWIDDGRPAQQHKPTPLPPRAALEVLAFEALLVAVAAGNVARGTTLSEKDLSRVLAAAGRINRLAEAYQ